MHTWEAHVRLQQDAFQQDIVLVQQAHDVAVYVLAPVCILLNAVVSRSQGHLWLHDGHKPTLLHMVSAAGDQEPVSPLSLAAANTNSAEGKVSSNPTQPCS